MYGLKTKAGPGEEDKLAKKPTRFMTNSIEIHEELRRGCDGKHEHQQLVDGRAKAAARYPEKLCKAICRGLARELRNESEKVKCLMRITAEDDMEVQEIEKLHEGEQEQEAWDDTTGEPLNPKEVMKARSKEMRYVREKRVGSKITRQEAAGRGIKVIKTSWLDINKGDKWNPNYRSRFVAKEFNNSGSCARWFAATPPLEALKLIISCVATVKEGEDRKAIMVNDVARAFFEAPTKREICIELPEEDIEEEEEEMVGLLRMSLYGTRDAAANFQGEIKKFMESIGFVQGRYNPCTFFHAGRELRTVVHGDDFVSTGTPEDLEWMKKELEGRFEISTQLIGHEHQTEGRVLSRIIRATPAGWEYEADQRHG